MNIIDSSGWLEYFLGSPIGALMKPVALNTDELIVPSITIYEVAKRLLLEKDEDYVYSVVVRMKRGKVINLDSELSIFAAKVGKDYHLPMADSIIYATALSCQAPGLPTVVWTTDKHFENLPQVRYFPK
jgi:predicted nucleic acid-binding protein